MKDCTYGKYSTGSGDILENDSMKEVFNKNSIKAYENEIANNIFKMGIKNLANIHVMNIGTGREAIAFLNLGAKFVSHYDYSKNNVRGLKEYVKINNIKNISSVCADIVDYKLANGKYDLVYVHGIVQHFRHTGKGLLNIIQSIKMGGKMWLYFYRSGTFSQFCLYLMRDLTKDVKNIYEYYIFALLMSSNNAKPNLLVSGFMDNCFSEYANLFTPESYINFVEDCGMKIIGSSKLEFLDKHINHKEAHPSVILICKKIKQPNGDINILSKSIDQLDTSLYSNEVVELIMEYRKLIISDSGKMALAYRIFRIEREAHVDYLEKGYYDIEKWYKLLKDLFVNINCGLSLEYIED